MGHAFDDDTDLTGAGTGFGAGMSHRWDTVGPPNGGFLLALAVRAVGRAVPFPDPITVTGHFLRPAGHTPVDIHVEPIRAGRGHATAMGAMHQSGREILRVLGTFADLGAAAGQTEPGDAGPPRLPSPAECVPAEDLRPRQWDGLPGGVPALYRSIEVRLARPERRQPGELARLEGWMRFADGREPDTAALPLLADAFPPAVLDISDAAWVPTVELTVHVRGRPAPGWIAASFRTRFLCDGYFEEDGELWDSTGRLVALSRQLAVTRGRRPTED